MNAADRSPNQQSSSALQPDLFGAPSRAPEGFRYLADLLSTEEEQELTREIEALPFKPFDFHGWEANRQVVGFGFRYDYSRREVVEAPPVPDFLEPLRQRIGEAFDRPPETFEQVLINEYRLGAGIGWRRDKPHFAEAVGVSLLAPCNFRLRRKSGDAWDRFSLTVEPRSAYLMSGPSRTIWEHSIPALDRHRYSITFRTLAKTSRG